MTFGFTDAIERALRVSFKYANIAMTDAVNRKGDWKRMLYYAAIFCDFKLNILQTPKVRSHSLEPNSCFAVRNLDSDLKYVYIYSIRTTGTN